MYPARDVVDNADHLEALDEAADALELEDDARTTARELFLSTVPDHERSKRPAVAASLYAGARIAGDGRSQRDVADAVGVSRLSVQARWRDLLAEAGLEPPSW